MSTDKSPLYLPWLLIICVSDEIVMTSHLYKFHSHIVVASKSINKKIWVSHPLLLCLQTSKMPNLIRTLWVKPTNFEIEEMMQLSGKVKEDKLK
jgi:hypothetical protein